MISGGIIFFIGLTIFLLNKFGIPFGKLPGDIYIDNENTKFYFPVVSFLILSLVLSVLLNLLLKIFK
ncbi:DUF2905 domain-containing protein [Candidatus Absconditicoccus praedator]|uniref:DUF2905 domain-containing protein n=1 Tax=Candidatus Absconditicoccus praedator TaxID=2735562 RepID=UPI001E53F170